MKKVFAFLMALVLAACASFACAETEKEIKFADYTFGMTMREAIEGKRFFSISLRSPSTSRNIADPVADSMMNMNGEPVYPVTYYVTMAADGVNKVAGYDADTLLYFYFPSTEDSASLNFLDGIFTAGVYRLYDNTPEIYADLQRKLSSVYGDPLAETENADDIWGPLTPLYSDPSGPDFASTLEGARTQYEGTKLTAWKSSANGAMIILTLKQIFGWTEVYLTYADLSADETILSLCVMPNEGSPAADDSLSGL